MGAVKGVGQVITPDYTDTNRWERNTLLMYEQYESIAARWKGVGDDSRRADKHTTKEDIIMAWTPRDIKDQVVQHP